MQEKAQKIHSRLEKIANAIEFAEKRSMQAHQFSSIKQKLEQQKTSENRSQFLKMRQNKVREICCHAKQVYEHFHEMKGSYIASLSKAIKDALFIAEENRFAYLEAIRKRLSTRNQQIKHACESLRVQYRLAKKHQVERASEISISVEERRIAYLQERERIARQQYCHVEEVCRYFYDTQKREVRRVTRNIENKQRAAFTNRQEFERKRKEQIMNRLRHTDDVRERYSQIHREDAVNAFAKGNPIWPHNCSILLFPQVAPAG